MLLRSGNNLVVQVIAVTLGLRSGYSGKSDPDTTYIV